MSELATKTRQRLFLTARLARLIESRNSVLTVAVAALLIYGALVSDVFFTWLNIRTILTDFVIEAAILTLGQGLVLLARGIDLSVGGTMALTSVTIGAVWSKLGASIWLAMAVGLAVSLGCGLLNGLLVARLRGAPMIVTLGTSILYGGIALGITGGLPFSGWSPSFGELGNGESGGIPNQLFVLAVVTLIVTGIVARTRYGRWLYAVGGNEHAARYSGVPVDAVRVSAYVACGFLAGIAGVITTSRLSTANSDIGVSAPFASITAAVLGGISVAGGEGRLYGALIGVIVVGVLENAMTLAGVATDVQLVAVGVVLVAAVGLDRLLSRRRITA